MINCVCPFCEGGHGFPGDHAGRLRPCRRCGRGFIVPDAVHGEGGTGSLPGIVPTQEELTAHLNERAGLRGGPSWLLGLLLPVAVAGFSVYEGFVKQDISFLNSLRSGAGVLVKGPAAQWAGAAGVFMALAIHAMLFWAPMPAFRKAAVAAGIAAAILALGATLVAVFI